MSQEVLATLQGCRLFGSVSAEGLAALAAIGQMEEYPRGISIFRQGDRPPGLFVVDEGAIRVFKLAPSGKEHLLHIAGPGKTFAEAAVIGGFPCPAHAEAMESSRCVLLPTRAFQKELRRDPELPMQLLVGMAVWVHNLVDLLEDVVLRDAAGRLARYLLEAADGDVVVLPSLKRHVASHLALTSETLSRTLGRLARNEWIEAGEGGRIRLLDQEALQALADGLEPAPGAEG